MKMKYLIKVLCGLTLFGVVSFDLPSDKHFEITKNIEIFTSVYAEVNKYYVDDINPSTFMKTGIDAMLESLDPYTNYIPEDAIEDYRFLSTGQYGGIGSIIGKRNGKSYILMPYEGFPAHKAGLKIGDVLLKVDDEDVTGMTTSEISKLLKGEAGKVVRVTIERYGQAEPMEFTLTREKIKVKNVPYYGMVTDDVGYLKLKDFTRDASKEVKNAIVELKEQGAKNIIVDLRGNPGGLLIEAISIANLFIDKGKEVVSTKGKVDRWNTTYNARNYPLDTEIPVVVLTSSRSASASEIVSGVIQDYDRGVLIGQRTFGKGLVQATKPTAYNTQVKITTAKYYIPSGRCIQAIDYSNRNDDGSVGKIPDSLRKEFKTMAGRPVFDGGGVLPDIVLEPTQWSDLAKTLYNENYLFDYVNEFVAGKDTLVSPKEFALTDADYDDFLSWLNKKEFDHQSPLAKSFDKWKETVEKDSLIDLDAEMQAIADKLKTDMKKELKVYKNEIRELLEEEIISRFYFRQGIVEASFDDDQEILAAVKLFKNPERYKEILKAQE